MVDNELFNGGIASFSFVKSLSWLVRRNSAFLDPKRSSSAPRLRFLVLLFDDTLSSEVLRRILTDLSLPRFGGKYDFFSSISMSESLVPSFDFFTLLMKLLNGWDSGKLDDSNRLPLKNDKFEVVESVVDGDDFRFFFSQNIEKSAK